MTEISDKKIVLTGGGTGGHIYPALSVAEELKSYPQVKDILYIGVKGQLEEKLAKQFGLKFIGLNTSGLPRRLSFELFSWPWQFALAVLNAAQALTKFQPAVVLGTGGYASAAPLAAALLKGIPIVVHEPDAHPGLVNRLFGQHAHLVSLGMEGALSYFPSHSLNAETVEAGVGPLALGRTVIVNGNPISSRFQEMPDKSECYAELGLDPQLKTLVITGGSQGAEALNNAVYEMLPKLLDGTLPLQVVHQVGEKNWGKIETSLNQPPFNSARYKAMRYIDNLAVPYAVADLTICRSGAMTLAELFHTGLPAIFIPYPYAAQDHQSFNARFVESRGGALVMPQSELTPQRLLCAVSELLSNAERLRLMREAMLKLARPDAARRLAKQILSL